MQTSMSILVAVLTALVVPVSAAAQVTAARDVEPVVITGAEVASWSGPQQTIVCQPYPSGALIGNRDAHNGIEVAPPAIGVPVDEIAAYRWDGAQFVEIPVQVDEMYYYCLSNPNSDFGVYSGTDKELTYAWDVESWKKVAGECTAEYAPGESAKPDPVPTLDADDEIVFMASDAGGQAPVGTLPPAGATDMQALTIIDPLNAANVSFVYLVRKPGGSSFDAANGYVDYARDANADQWIDRFSFDAFDPEKLGSSNTGYGPNLSGTVCDPPGNTPRASTDRFSRDGVTVSTDTYQWIATGRWMVRDLHVAKPNQPGVYGPDLIDRWKGRAFQQSPDSTISLVGFEDEQVNWEANAALLGELMGPVRAIRETWGADSGTNVTKTESFYRDAITYRYHVRVHPIPPDGLYTSWDYNAGVGVKYYNVVKTAGVDIDGINDDAGNIDSVSNFPAFFDIPDPTFNAPSALLNWEQVSGAGDAGSLVYIIELKGPTTFTNSAVVPYYRDDKCLDDGTGDDPVQRPWPGEASTDQRVKDGYSQAAGGTPYEQLTCDQKQGAWGAHGVHYFFTQDSDNLASPETLTEIDSQQWQFTVPTEQPTNVGDPYANVVKAPLQVAAVPIPTIPLPSAPAASDNIAATDQDTPVDVELRGVDQQTCELTFSIVTPPANGDLSAITNQACAAGTPNVDSATVTYTPDTAFAGEDSFTYKVNDGTQDSNTATVTITVRADPTPIPTTTATPQPTVTATSTGGGPTATSGGTPGSTATATPTAGPTPPPPAGCGSSTLCGSAPANGCKSPVQLGQSSLFVKNKSPDAGDRLTWKWIKGAATAKAEFGDPVHTTDYELCVYDGSNSLVSRACAPRDNLCDGKPCWRELSSGFKYRKRDSAGGLKNSLQVLLRAGADGKGKIIVKGKGTAFAMPHLPMSQPVTVQLVNGGGVCWETTHSAPAQRNDSEQLKDKSD